MVTAISYPKTLTETRARVESTWSEWVRAVECVPASRRLESGVCGYWSLKDLIAHIALWENYVPEHVQRWLLDLPVLEVDVDVLNAEVVRENADRSFEMVLMDMHRAHQSALAAIATIERDLDDDIGERIACETWDHYPGHTAQIFAWLGSAVEGNSMDASAIAERYVKRVNDALDIAARVPVDRRSQPGVIDQQSVKDLIGHCAYWDGVHVVELETEFAGGTILEDGRDEDVVNAEQFQIRADWTWDQTIDEATRNRDRLDQLLRRPSQYDQAGSGEHWGEHRSQIEAWLAKLDQSH